VLQSSMTQDCATQRFLVWAAIKRNRSLKLDAKERLACPLVRCGERFEEHESMLRHLSKCQHLKTGEYVCYECMAVEKFNDGSRRCCSTQPSKRRKIVKLAKNFFSSIGNKSRRAEPEAIDEDDTASLPPAYDDMEETCPAEFDTEPSNPQLELNGDGIVEMDGVMVHQLDSVNYDGSSAGDPPVQIDTTTGLTQDMSNSPQSQQQCPPLPLAQQGPGRNMSPIPGPCSPSGFQRPSLALNTEVDQYRKVTHGKYLTPSSSVRSQQSSQQNANMISPITPWSASSAASGVSADSWMLHSGVNTHATSPTSPISPLGNEMNTMHGYLIPKATEVRNYGDGSAGTYFDKAKSKRPADYSQPDLPVPNIPENIFYPSTEEREAYSWLSSNNTELCLGPSINVMSFDDNTTFQNDYAQFTEPAMATDAGKMLVETVWGVLRQHVEISSAKVLELGNNPLVVRLRQESATSVATRGFESLRNLLNDKSPSDPLDYLCFVHLVYAFSLVLHEDDLGTKSELLFRQALAYREFLNPAWYDVYTQVVLRIWNPESHTALQGNDLLISQRRLSSRIPSGQLRTTPGAAANKDALLMVSQNFLDEFESLVVNSKIMRPTDILSSPLWLTHAEDLRVDRGTGQPFIVGANYIINVLSQSFRDNPGLPPRLRDVAQRVRNRTTVTVRMLEMELMQAGKVALPKPRFFDAFVPQVRRHCSTLYANHSNSPRAKHHTQAASFAEQLLHDAARDTPPPQQSRPIDLSTLPLNEHNALEEFLQMPIGGPFSLPEGMENFQQGPINTGFPRYPGPGPATPMLSVSGPHHVGMASQSPYPTPFPRQGILTPDLITIDRSPVVVPATINPEAQRPAGTKRRACDLEEQQQVAKKAHSASASVPTRQATAQVSTGSPAEGASTPRVEANSGCEICGYKPKGDPQWFKGSMAKHKKLQHSQEPPTIYKCPFPGCTSAYKNRQDNLRQHQIEKNHFVEDQGHQRRPNKRKKAS